MLACSCLRAFVGKGVERCLFVLARGDLCSRLDLVLVDVSHLAAAAVEDKRAVEDDESALTHEHDQVLKFDHGEVLDVRVVYPVALLFESEVLHHIDTEHILNKLVLIDHERDIPCILRQKGQHCLAGIALTSEEFSFAHVQVAANVAEGLIMVLSQLRHHEVNWTVIRRVSPCYEFAGRWLVTAATEWHEACRDLARFKFLGCSVRSIAS